MKFIYTLLAISFFLAVTLTDWNMVYEFISNPSEELLQVICTISWVVFAAICAGLAWDFFESTGDES